MSKKNKKKNNNIIDVKSIKNKISDIPIIISKNNNVYNSFDLLYNPKNKKYFDIDNIKNELNEVKKRDFLKRKSFVR